MLHPVYAIWISVIPKHRSGMRIGGVRLVADLRVSMSSFNVMFSMKCGYRIGYEHSYPYNLGSFQQAIDTLYTYRGELLTLSTGESEFVA